MLYLPAPSKLLGVAESGVVAGNGSPPYHSCHLIGLPPSDDCALSAHRFHVTIMGLKLYDFLRPIFFAESVKYICPAPRQDERAYDPIQSHLPWSDHSIFPRMVLGDLVSLSRLPCHSCHSISGCRFAMKGTIALPPLAVSPSPVLSYICFKVELWLS